MGMHSIRKSGTLPLLVGLAGLIGAAARTDAAPKPAADPLKSITALQLQPASLSFANRDDVRRVLVLGMTKAGYAVDLTDLAVLQPQAGLVKAEKSGFLTP